ncbi:MAG: HlyD family efflux transporter periplasmic adaptor subunit [Rhodobacteraceae bacterium]|nr:HlyD family efflux transporter periplasmic adaptor subunit [Paracoccaceae bacterium]
MRFLKRSLLGLFLLGMSLGLLVIAGDMLYSSIQERMANGQPQRPQGERAYTATVLVAERTSIQPVISTFGEIVSTHTLEVRAPIGGTIVGLSPNFVEGGKVAEGELILEIDPSDAKSTLDLAIADMNDAKVGLADAERLLDLARDDLVAADLQVNLRQRAYERSVTLLERGVGTSTDLDNAEIALSTALQAVLTKKRALAQAETRLEQATTALDRRQISVSEAERKLSQTRLFAEFDGIFTNVTAIEGGLVTPNERLARLIDPEALEVSFRVSSLQYSHLLDDNGSLVSAEVDIDLSLGNNSLSTTGVITRESPAVGEGQTGRLLIAHIEGSETNALRPGDFVTVSILEPEMQNVFVVPATAVNSESEILAVNDQNRLEELEVRVLRKQGDDVILANRGLDGRTIIAERSPTLGEGIRIEARMAAPEGAEPAFEEPQMVALSDEERNELIQRVEANQFIPADVKQRILKQLEEDEIPKDMLERLRGRG